MADLINNLADHLGLDLTFKDINHGIVRLYRMIDGWEYYTSIPYYPPSRHTETWLQIANDHIDAAEKMEQ